MLIVDNNFVMDNTKLVRFLLKKRMKSVSANAEEFNDLVTDTFLKCMQNARYYSDEYTVATFLGLQARSAVAEYVNVKDRVNNKDALNFSMELLPEHDTPVEEDDSDDEETMDFLRCRLAPYLHVLSPTEHAVIINLVWNRLSVNETAEKLDMLPRSVSTIKTRARNKLTAYLQKGRRVNKKQEVDVDVPLESAIMQLPDTQYHAYRLHHFKGWSISRVAATMGRTMAEVAHFIEQAKSSIAYNYGYRA